MNPRLAKRSQQTPLMAKRRLLVFEHLDAFKSMYAILNPLIIICSIEMLIPSQRILAITTHTLGI